MRLVSTVGPLGGGGGQRSIRQIIKLAISAAKHAAEHSDPAAVRLLESQLESTDPVIANAAARALLAHSAITSKLALEHGTESIDADGEDVTPVERGALGAELRRRFQVIETTPDKGHNGHGGNGHGNGHGG